jgi:hypothetical protein
MGNRAWRMENNYLLPRSQLSITTSPMPHADTKLPCAYSTAAKTKTS